MTNLNTEPKTALILIEYVNDWLSPTGGIYPSFQDREQVDTAIANSKIALTEAPTSRHACDPRLAEVRA